MRSAWMWGAGMSRLCDEVAICILGTMGDHRSCRAVLVDDGNVVTICQRCSALLGLSVKEVFDAHVQRISEVVEVVVGDLASSGQEVGEDAVADPGRGRDLVDGPSLFGHALAEGSVGGEGSSHAHIVSPGTGEVLE